MRRQLYTIEWVEGRNDEAAKKAAELFKKVREIRRILSEAVRVTRSLPEPPKIHGLRAVVSTLRHTARFNLERSNERLLVRRIHGTSVSASLDGGLKNAMMSIREQVKEQRAVNRGFDELKQKKPGEILKRYHSKILSFSKRPRTETRHIGIEIECIVPSETDWGPLLPYAQYVSVGGDGSITGVDAGEADAEIRICVPQDDLRSVVPGVLAALREIGARVNASCGLHVHIDQRDRSNIEAIYERLVKAQALLFSIVPPSRRSNRYCRRSRIAEFSRAQYQTRYRAINAAAYHSHKTIEVRLFGGTLDAEKVLNWVEVLHAIAYGETPRRSPRTLRAIRRCWPTLTDANVAWLKERREKFARRPAPTPATSGAPVYAPESIHPMLIPDNPERDLAVAALLPVSDSSFREAVLTGRHEAVLPPVEVPRLAEDAAPSRLVYSMSASQYYRRSRTPITEEE